MKRLQAKFNVSELERRPEFTESGAGPSRASAIPPHMTTGTKPFPPVNIRPHHHDSPKTAPDPLLASSAQPEEESVLVDESFDAEFAGIDDVLFDEINTLGGNR